MQRKVATCINCKEGREIAAHGLCFKCYRAEEREAENSFAAPDRHNRAQLKQLKKLRKCITSILNSVDDGIDVLDPDDVDSMRGILQPYFVSLADGLAPRRKSKVNSEQNEEDDVHCSLVQAALENNVRIVNSEQVTGVHNSQPQVLTIPPVTPSDAPSIDEGDVQNKITHDVPAMSGESQADGDTNTIEDPDDLEDDDEEEDEEEDEPDCAGESLSPCSGDDWIACDGCGKMLCVVHGSSNTVVHLDPPNMLPTFLCSDCGEKAECRGDTDDGCYEYPDS
jgi:hypothetical protein